MKIASVLLVFSACSIAHAQRNAIDVVARLQGETEWHDFLNYTSDYEPAHIEVAVFYDRASGYGFSGSVHNVVSDIWNPSLGDSVTLLDRPDSAHHPDGRQGRFNFGGQAQFVYTTGLDAGRMRIGARNNFQNASAGGISVKQRPPATSGALFDTSNPVMGFRFDLVLGFRPGFVTTTYELSTPLNDINSFTIYDTPNSTYGISIPQGTLLLDPAFITTHFTQPTPGSLTAFCLVGAAAARRKRPE